VIVLDLCGGSGSWSQPWADAGFEVVIVDIRYGFDVRDYKPPANVVGVLAAPPCTEFAGSGARWWADKSTHLLTEAVEIVRACLDIIQTAKPAWWALENPVGRLPRCVPELGRWRYTFQPYEYGDPYTKRTCIWGDHVRPVRSPVEPTEGSKLWRLPPSPHRRAVRSVTPQGFAKAFFEANHHPDP
tara:strand:+ start:705 stop:1262 length:558 start_codon:yes stop_codon:yes gene_type:complete